MFSTNVTGFDNLKTGYANDEDFGNVRNDKEIYFFLSING
jgi:hypothetical protein